MSSSSPSSLPDRLRHDLVEAMKAGDRAAVAALRQALAAIANAEAPAAPTLRLVPSEPEVGRLVEHQRLDLSEADVDRILRAEIAERETAAADYLRIDRPSEAAAVEAEAAVLRTYLG